LLSLKHFDVYVGFTSHPLVVFTDHNPLTFINKVFYERSLKAFKGKWLCENTDISILDYVSGFKHKLTRACEIAHENVKQSQLKFKQWYNKDARMREFKPGEKVLVLLPVPGHPLEAQYFGPYIIKSRLNDLNYIMNATTGRKKRQICQVTAPYFLK